MDTIITKEWGLRIVSPTSLNFYHVILPRIGIRPLSENLKNYKSIELLGDQSVLITAETPIDRELIKLELERLLEKLESNFAQTQKFNYKIGNKHKDFLKNWFFSIEGGLALIIISKMPKLKLKPYDFELINSTVGGVYLPAGRQGLHPFTILFHDDHAKVIHPIKISNFFLREEIEKTIAQSMRGILQRAEESQRGFEGLALLSYIREKTGLPPKMIGSIIDEKSGFITLPKHSPLLI